MHIALPIGLGMMCLSAPIAALAEPSGDARTASPDSQIASVGSDDANNGSDITRPQNSVETRLNDQTSGSPTSETNRGALIFRLNSKVTFDDGWKLGTLAEIPLVTRSTSIFDPPDTVQASGVGSAVFQSIISRSLDERWAVGVGARFVARSITNDVGNGKWQIMPGFGVRYSILEWGDDSYFVPAMRYAISFAGDPSARRISEAQVAPTLNIDLPGRWFLTFYPSYDIRINFGAPKAGQTGALFLPVDALAGVKLTNNLQISLEVGVPIVKEYPVYNFKTEARVRVSF